MHLLNIFVTIFIFGHPGTFLRASRKKYVDDRVKMTGMGETLRAEDGPQPGAYHHAKHEREGGSRDALPSPPIDGQIVEKQGG